MLRRRRNPRIRLGYYISENSPRGRKELGTRDFDEALDIIWEMSERVESLLYLWQRHPQHWELVSAWQHGRELDLEEYEHPASPKLTPKLIEQIEQRRQERLVSFPYKRAPALVRRKRVPMLWRAGANVTNIKTGPIPTSYVGETQEESLLSCLGCGLLPARFGGPGDAEARHGACYAWIGQTGGAALKHIQRKAAQDPELMSFEYAMKHRWPEARGMRAGAIGDPARAYRRQIHKMFNYGAAFNLFILGYTHHWRDPEAQDLKGLFLASTNSPEEADLALSMGWTPTTVLPWYFTEKTFVTPAGGRGLVCPAQVRPDITGKQISVGGYVGITCNSCGMCDVNHPVWTKIDVIGFVEHGTKVSKEMASFGFYQHPISQKPDKRPPLRLPIVE